MSDDTSVPSSLPRRPDDASRLVHALKIAPRLPAVGFMRAYRATVSRLYGPVCKFYPSCSQYALDAFEVQGLLRGGISTTWRLCRCHPWSRGGVDYVPGSELERRSALLGASGSQWQNEQSAPHTTATRRGELN